MDYDVVVIGAGPAGSSAAREIAQQGWRVALLERGAYPGQRAVCGGMVSLAMVQQYGVLPALEKVMRSELHVLPWGVVENTTEQCTVQREIFDRMLAEHAVSAGAELLTHTHAQSIDIVGSGHVEIKVHCRALERTLHSTLRARGVILADGPQTLARSLGIGYSPGERGTAFALTYELTWPNNEMDHYELYYGDQVARWGYAWIFPYRDTLNIGLGCILSELHRRDNLKHDLMDFIQCHPRASALLRDKPIARQRGGWIPLRAARRMVAPATLVAGDAAGLVHPLIAAGLDNALTSGSMAGQVMSAALAVGDLSVDFLARFEHQWRQTPAARFMRIQNWIAYIGHLFIGLDQNVLAKIIQLALLGGSLTWPGKVQALSYPWLGMPTKSKRARRNQHISLDQGEA